MGCLCSKGRTKSPGVEQRYQPSSPASVKISQGLQQNPSTDSTPKVLKPPGSPSEKISARQVTKPKSRTEPEPDVPTTTVSSPQANPSPSGKQQRPPLLRQPQPSIPSHPPTVSESFNGKLQNIPPPITPQQQKQDAEPSSTEPRPSIPPQSKHDNLPNLGKAMLSKSFNGKAKNVAPLAPPEKRQESAPSSADPRPSIPTQSKHDNLPNLGKPMPSESFNGKAKNYPSFVRPQQQQQKAAQSTTNPRSSIPPPSKHDNLPNLGNPKLSESCDHFKHDNLPNKPVLDHEFNIGLICK